MRFYTFIYLRLKINKKWIFVQFSSPIACIISKIQQFELQRFHSAQCLLRDSESDLDFHCHATKKEIENRPVEEAPKKMKCVKRLIYKQFVQVSGLFGPQCLSYLLIRFTHLCRALYRDAMLVYHFGPPIWPPKIIKNIWSSLFL